MNVGEKAHEFLGKAAPVGYVAGLGRGGAHGFVTGSDVVPIQPANLAHTVDPLLQEDDANLSQDEPDEAGLLSTTLLTKEDKEAIEIYNHVSQVISSRRSMGKQTTDEPENEIVRLKREFSTLKKSMVTVSAEEWANLPDAVSVVKKRKKENPRDSFLPLPDNIILDGLGQESSYSNSIPSNDIAQFKDAREQALNIKLEKASRSLIDPEDQFDAEQYLTSLTSSAEEFADLKRARALYRSITVADPKNSSAWIAYARVEEKGNNLKEARRIVRKGIENCKRSEELWIELVRLFSSCKSSDYDQVIQEALSNVPHCASLWLVACEREKEMVKKQKLFTRALEFNPKSVELWKHFIEIENEPECAKILLQNAVECVPDKVDFWIALAKLETYENAKRILNKAIVNCPKQSKIWLEAMKLEEQQSKMQKITDGTTLKLVDYPQIDALMEKALADLLDLSRSDWTSMAMECEKQCFIQTAQSVISKTIILGMEEQRESWKAVWLQDVDNFIAEKCFESARSLFRNATHLLYDKKSIWKRFAFFEQQHGTIESFVDTMTAATTACPNAEVLWLIYAKHIWNVEGGEKALLILQQALVVNSTSEEIILAQCKVLVALQNFTAAKELLETSKEVLSECPKLWMKLIILERNMGNNNSSLALLDKAINLYPEYYKFYLIKSQILSDIPIESLAALELGTRKCPNSIPLWIQLAKFEQLQGKGVKARSTLEKARLSNPKNELLWETALFVEVENANQAGWRSIMIRALKECPSSGLLHYHAIMHEPKSTRLSKAGEYLKKLPHNPWILFAYAQCYEADMKLENALKWYQNTIENNTKMSLGIADFYLYFYAFLVRNSKTDLANEVKNEFLQSACVYGSLWIKHRKDPQNWLLSTEEIFIQATNELLQNA